MNLQWLGALSHARAREVLEAAFRQSFGREAKMPALQYSQSVSLVEGGYGQSQYKNRLTGESRVLRNWGAEQCRSRPPCPENCFEATDTHEGGDAYQACFKIFSTDEQGAASFLKTLYGGARSGVLRLAEQGDFRGAVAEQRRTGYYEAPEEKYWSAVDTRVDQVAAALHEPRGDHGAVRLLARGRVALPYLLAIGAVGTAAYFYSPAVRRETQSLARSGRKLLSF